ncbi:hypothetical protein MLD38_005170 [Melastoma candidum]|uniref:Uncharacterized protein n=1 Tax=Melastoma candidum TaxID=119954 RepID=A0ACB9S855_9MYRT|nr:hypothetical protein MLD38_005170 [Melastoma candidum]
MSMSGEEEDREVLIPQNDTENPGGAHISVTSDLGFDGYKTKSKLYSLRNYKRYLVAIFTLPVVIAAILYLSMQGTFSYERVGVGLKIRSPVGDGVRESELRALYLLRQQNLGLSNLLGRSNSSSPGSDGNSSSSHGGAGARLVADVRDALIEQLRINREIQDVLLSTHRVGNVSAASGNSESLDLGGFYRMNRCKKVDLRFSDRKTLGWKPKKNKYLLAICVSGQMSNHLICLEKHMFFAATLGRVLVIPSLKVDYQYSRVLDIEHINDCLGREVVVPYEKFAESRKNRVRIDRFICYFSLPQHCYVDEEHLRKLKGLGVSMGKLESPWAEDVKKPNKKTIDDVKAKFSVDDDVIAIGDVFFADVDSEWVMQPGGPIAHKCKALIEPSQLILLTAQRFIQTFLGKDYISLHFRRHGFLKFCNVKRPSCFYPIPQAAECINRLAEKANAPVIYLSTDAAESETGLLQSLIQVNGNHIPLVKRPVRNSAEKWDALLYRHNLEGDPQVEAMLDKTICAMSSVFIGASGSTFTEDILRLRKDWGSASVCDEYLCQGEEPNFITGNE